LEKRLKLAWAAMAKGADMNEHPTDLDQTDEEILTSTVSDEVLEAAAVGKRWGGASSSPDTSIPTYCGVCGCVS
jgi:hypothetical protein